MITVDDFDDAAQYIDDLRTDLDRLKHDQERLQYNDVDSLQSTCSTLEERIDDVEGALQQLADRVAVIERRALNTSSVRADLDTVSSADRARARRARRAKQLQAVLLSEVDRTSKQRTIEFYERDLATLATCQEAVVAAARVLADLGDRDPRNQSHQQARAQYEKALGGLTRAQKAIPEYRPANVRGCREQLAADAKLRAKHGADIDSGHEEFLLLREKVRARLEKAVASGELLPVWFTTVLGPTPPAASTQEWMRTATSLLAYRLLYGVTDAVVALGPAPGNTDAARRSWYAELSRALPWRGR